MQLIILAGAGACAIASFFRMRTPAVPRRVACRVGVTAVALVPAGRSAADKPKRRVPIAAVCTVAAVYVVRMFLRDSAFGGYFGLSESPLPAALTVIGLVILIGQQAAFVFVLLNPFLKCKISDAITVYFVLPQTLLSVLGYYLSARLVTSGTGASVHALFFALEVLGFAALGLTQGVAALTRGGKPALPALEKRYVGAFVAAMVGMLLLGLPSDALHALFGRGPIVKMVDFSQYHRILLYIGFFAPLGLYFWLKNHTLESKRLAFSYIAYATMFTYADIYLFSSFTSPTGWPLHLCNTAMFVLPLVLTFKLEKVFYFTYFINVLGALLAMLMPNYSVHNLFERSAYTFWVNHLCAFFMPLLAVALGLFPRPRLRQFIYSMVGFAVYFIVILWLNAWFTNYDAGVDYFFLNGDFITDKLGLESLREVVLRFQIGSLRFVLYPLYQAVFFLVYVAAGVVMWFIYENAFMFADSLHDLAARTRKIRVEEYAFFEKLGSDHTLPVNPEGAGMIEIINLSKKYGKDKAFAVQNISLTVNPGEVFGFLGPNGAGKSTIIKSLVGIQPVTSGSIRVCGFDVEKQSVQAKLHIGFVPDHYALYERLTGREYINYVADLYGVSKEDRTERLARYAQRFEMETAIDSAIRTYSHGMKQKVSTIAALIHNPAVWILDEPLTGLDPNSIFQMKEVMKEHARAGNIVFFSSHIMDVVERLCDRFAVIKNGQIVDLRSMEEVTNGGGTLEDYYLKLIESTGANRNSVSG
ncbi:MAG: YwaF family protein [Clostridiales bacterium]|nr:YwaF family protein [Clostridiales bacterium]